MNQKHEQTDQILVESTAGELNSAYGVYEADLVTRSILDETAIPSDGPIMICAERSVCTCSGPTILGATWNRHSMRESEGSSRHSSLQTLCCHLRVTEKFKAQWNYPLTAHRAHMGGVHNWHMWAQWNYPLTASDQPSGVVV